MKLELILYNCVIKKKLSFVCFTGKITVTLGLINCKFTTLKNSSAPCTGQGVSHYTKRHQRAC